MKTTKKVVMALAGIVLGLIISPVALSEAYAYERGGVLEETKDVFYFRGDITSPQDQKPYGGDVIGKYFVMVNVDFVKIIAEFENPSLEGQVLEAWLVDFGGESKVTIGVFENNELATSASIDEWKYEAIVISEVSESSSAPENPVGGAVLEKASKHKSNKSF